MRPRIRGVLWLPAAVSFMVLYALCLSSGAQETVAKGKAEERGRPTKPQLESKSPQEEPAAQKKGYTIGVNVDLVVVHTSVYDKNNHFLGGLKKENFRVFEDGIEQKVISFSQEDVPVSMGILIDLSGSMRSKIANVNKAALAFIRASNPQDQVFLIGFNDQVELLQDLDEISDALENTVVTGGTALYDAIYLGVQKAQTGTDPKKAVVVISDGEDRDSYYKLDELVAKVEESDVQVYCIGFLNEVPDKGLFGRWSKSIPEKAHDALQRIAEETGGNDFFPKQISEINGIVAEIANELRNQYSIGYISSNAARDGSWRRLKIELDPSAAANAHVRFRRGYYAPSAPGESSQKAPDAAP
jgi:Ca-activated chloride channel family protein